MPPKDTTKELIKKLIWVYFLLLLFEGVLRKWITPGMSRELLVVRDPLVLAIYLLAFSSGRFPINNKYIRALFVITCISFAFSFLSGRFHLITSLFGARTMILHFPLIFIIYNVFDYKDVIKIGNAFLLLSIPMVYIVVKQFEADPDSILNTTAGGSGSQLETAGGKVRASGTFTFVNGIVYYFSFVTAFVLCGYLRKKTFRLIVLYIGMITTVLAMATSGSRSVVAGCMQVIGCFGFLAFYQFRAFGGMAGFLFGSSAIGLFVYQLDIFQEGLRYLNLRFEEAANVEGTPVEAYIERNLQILNAPLIDTFRAPIFGIGLGSGTNAGAALSGGFFGENEWSRNIWEAGPIAGNAFILWRIILCYAILMLAIKSIKNGNYLPIFLFGAAGPLLLFEQIGQPTTLGFSVLGIGLCLASTKISKTTI